MGEFHPSVFRNLDPHPNKDHSMGPLNGGIQLDTKRGVVFVQG